MSMNPILIPFVHLYGNAASSYNLVGDPLNDEPLTVTVWFPNQPDKVFYCEPASDDGGYYTFRLVDTPIEICIPYPTG
jgi:hypothetical protein